MTVTAGWKLDHSFDAAAVHIRPRADTIWHPLDDGCVCGPVVQPCRRRPGGDAWLVIHHSLDGREADE